MFKDLFENKTKLSNIGKKPPIYYQSKNFIRGLMIFSAAVLVVGALYGIAFLVNGFMLNSTYSLTYSCSGVDKEWLINHPFDTSTFPAKLKKKDPLKLHAPIIENYTFIEWTIKWETDDSSESPTFTFKDGETYRVAPFSTSVPIKLTSAVVIATYAKN